jgi:hypothetical protein
LVVVLFFPQRSATSRQSIPNKHDDVWPPPLFLLINRSNAAPRTLRVREQVDCYVNEVLLAQQQLHTPSCTSFVHKSADVHQLVQSHQTISVVLMAKSANSGRSPATLEALEGIGWLGGWFGCGAEAAGHGFDG